MVTSRLHPNHRRKLLSRLPSRLPRSGCGGRAALQLDDEARRIVLFDDAAVEACAEIRLQLPCRGAYAAPHTRRIPNASLCNEGAGQEEAERLHRLVRDAPHVCHSTACPKYSPCPSDSGRKGGEVVLLPASANLLLPFYVYSVGSMLHFVLRASYFFCVLFRDRVAPRGRRYGRHIAYPNKQSLPTNCWLRLLISICPI
jgi:hypothetical protein